MATKPEYQPLSRPSSVPAPPWRPGLRYFPWIAGLSIAVKAACISTSIAIIILSDKKPVSSWRLNPTVLLAVVSSIANTATSIGFSQGAAIAWWRSVLHGTTLRDLHYNWCFGRSSFSPTLKLSKNMLKMALVALVLTGTAIVNNPLLQRTAKVKNGSASSEPVLSIDLMQNPLGQAYGIVQQGLPGDTLVFTIFVQSFKDWYNATAIPVSNATGYSCDGDCIGTITTPGLDVNCSTSTGNLNFGNVANNGDAMFSINFTWSVNDQGNTLLGLDVLYASSVDENCVASMNMEHCDIAAALVQREIEIQNHTLALRTTPAKLLSRYYSHLDSIGAATGTYAGPLSALYNFGSFYFASSFTLDFGVGNVAGSQAHGIVSAGQQYQVINNSTTLPCQYTFISPVADIISAMEEVLFRIAYAPGQEQYTMETQHVPVTQVTNTLVFHSNYHYLEIAVAVEALSLLFLLILLWGWWELGRKVGLSPIETAKAFGAPLIKDGTPANDAKDIVSQLGDFRVRYGEVADAYGVAGTIVPRLAIAAHDDVLKPGRRKSFCGVGTGPVVYITEVPPLH